MSAAEPGADGLAWTVYCDGSAMPNPGRMGIGAVITAPDGERHTLSQATHTTGCNNEAELLALTLALQDLRARGATAVRAYSDNSILVEQLDGRAVAPIARLAGLFDEARALLDSFDDVRVHWIPRHRNAEADALARAALGFAPKPPARRTRKRR
ncbi:MULTISPECIES: ribonuclease HI family protein [unclassified Variovorax]|jgi:ribonuclease HI|uniref:ribonuclease HI family protein n=1 Tax=unclassified Variovorax TaxID=663243 RepID=UPI000F7DEDC7|nr:MULTISPECIES: ribonuclease HI family protein [unclassified Variovorax]RSZ33204.1 ribonuclease HI family protein [Variovorax sp. 553]RSZ33575.1 ribonuclease HI family protein [Variovorax sp. 679]